jgi:hypothetical protein
MEIRIIKSPDRDVARAFYRYGKSTQLNPEFAVAIYCGLAGS